jgi:hypothetical protein
MSGKLHELLAVEGDKESVYKKLVDEGIVTFTKKPDHFQGSLRTLEMFAADEKKESTAAAKAMPTPEERKELVETVHDKLQYVLESAAAYYDLLLQKESTNQIAKADLVVEGTVLAKDVPATFLLGMENRLKRIRDLIEATPTLAPGIKWEPDATQGAHIYRRVHPEQKYKAVKQFKSQVLYEATDKHPAQIEKWEEPTNVGMYTTQQWTSMISPAEKSTLLARTDKLIQAVKKARRRANDVAIVDRTISSEMFKYIMGE